MTNEDDVDVLLLRGVSFFRLRLDLRAWLGGRNKRFATPLFVVGCCDGSPGAGMIVPRISLRQPTTFLHLRVLFVHVVVSGTGSIDVHAVSADNGI